MKVTESPSHRVETYHITPMKDKHDVIGASLRVTESPSLQVTK